MVDSDEVVAAWIRGVKTGDEESQRRIWEEYFLRIVGLARKQLGNLPRRVVDEEDVVISVMDSFFRRARGGQFAWMHDRTDLWALLARITIAKSINQYNRQTAQKRGGHRVKDQSVLEASNSGNQIGSLDDFADKPVTSQDADGFCLLCRELMQKLANNELRLVAQRRLEGYTNKEIAVEINKSQTSVENKLKLIRNTWELEL